MLNKLVTKCNQLNANKFQRINVNQVFLTIQTQNTVLIKSFALFEIKCLKIVSIMNIFCWNISKTPKILKMVSDTTQLSKVQQRNSWLSTVFFIIELIYLLYKVYNWGQNRYIIRYNKGTISTILRKKLWFLMFYNFFFQNPIDINEIGCIIKVWFRKSSETSLFLQSEWYVVCHSFLFVIFSYKTWAISNFCRIYTFFVINFLLKIV